MSVLSGFKYSGFVLLGGLLPEPPEGNIRPDAYLCLRFVSVSLAMIIAKRSRERKQNIGVLFTIIRS